MEKKFLLVGALLLAGGFSTMNADVIYGDFYKLNP